METVEILAGGEFANAVKSLGLTSAVCAYHYQPQPTHWREEYQVWLLSKEDFDNICAIDNDDWKDDWGWWRHAYGSNLGTVDCAYIINGEKLMAWDGLQRKEWCQDCSDCAGTEKDKDECFHDHQYPDILIYLCDEIGASTERNVCACMIDLARQNNLTLAELFKKYLGQVVMVVIKILILTEDRDTWVQKITSELRRCNCRKMLKPYQIQSGLFFFEIRSHYSENCKGECWSCVILDQYIPHELEVCVLRPCVKNSIIRTKNYQIGWEANENAHH